MNRRQFLFSLATCSVPGLASAYPSTPYAPQTWPELRDSTPKVVLNFQASWSITCQIKQEIISSLLAENPSYGALTFVDVDWDTFGPSEWVEKRLKVERRSTLLALRGTDEVARLVNEPYERRIRAFLDTVLKA